MLGIKVNFLNLIKTTQLKQIAKIIFTGEILIPLKNGSKTRTHTISLILNIVVEAK